MTPETGVLQVLAACDVCPPGTPTEGRLFAVVDDRRLCVAHWLAAGRPWLRGTATSLEVHEAELRTREAMLRRGGPDRYMARSGRT